MHLLPGPKTKPSNTLSEPLFQQVLSTRETRSRRCSVGVVEFRLSLPGTVSVSLNLWFFFVCDGSFYHRLNLLWLAFRSSNFFFYLKTFSLCFADVVRVKKTIIIAEENNLNRNWPRYARARVLQNQTGSCGSGTGSAFRHTPSLRPIWAISSNGAGVVSLFYRFFRFVQIAII